MQLLFSITWGSVSGWWLPGCILAGLLYAWLLYKQPVALKPAYRYILFAFRAVVIALAFFLLIAPLVRSVTYKPQKPLVLVLQDNSASIKLFGSKASSANDGLYQSLSSLKTQLGGEYDIRDFHFSDSLGNGLTTSFSGKHTNIAKALHELNDRFVNQNVGAIVLATDGIYNQGSDPLYEARNIKTNIYTVALGDTIPRRDLLISNINYNKTALLGNDFLLEILTVAYQAKGETMHLSVSDGQRKLYSQDIPITGDDFHKVVTAKLSALKKGLQRYNVSITPAANELSVKNNSEPVYVDVIDARQKVLIIYDAPHPDIGALKLFLQDNKNLQVDAVQTADLAKHNINENSLVILYQVSASANPALKNLLTGKMPLWFIAGSETNIQEFNNGQKLVSIDAGRAELQEVFPQPVITFSAFALSDSTLKKIAALPPLLAPFGSYSPAASARVLLKQRIGSVGTAYPLLAFSDDGERREAVLTGEGIWRWELGEFQLYGNHHAMQELFSQAVQYLTANASRRRFAVFSDRRVFDEGENVVLSAELYDEALNLVNTPDIKINLNSAAGKNYSFLFSRSGNSYRLDAGALPAGEYTYSAATTLGQKQFKANGQVIINPLNLEFQQTAANHQLLRALAARSGGKMVYPNAVSSLAGLIRQNENVKTVVYQDSRYNELIESGWLFALVVTLMSIEWFLRKREGEI